MKILEIISPSIIDKNTKQKFNFRNANDYYEKYFTQGEDEHSGSYARGEEDERDPHMFNKKSYFPSNLDKDAYYQYIKKIGPYISGNPYLPRVYIIKLIKHKDGHIKPEYKMEKLEGWENFDTDEIYAMSKRMFGPGNGCIRPSTIMNYCMRIFEGIINTNGMDDKLIDALNLIYEVKNLNRDFHEDFSDDNVMLRRTKYGPQMVFIDPLFDISRSSQIKNS